MVSIGGTDYLIKGPRNSGGCADVGGAIINQGWTISSVNGSDIATSADGTYDGGGPVCTGNTATGTSGGVAAASEDGVSIVDNAGLVTTASATITAPNTTGSVPGDAESLVNNSVSNVAPASGGTGNNNLNNTFDQIWGLAATVAPYNGATRYLFGTVATLNVTGASATISTSTGQPAGAQAIGRTSFTASKTVALTGSAFTAGQGVGTATVAFCNTSGGAATLLLR